MSSDACPRPTAERVTPKGVTRYEYGRARGWLARVYRTAEGESQCLRKLFSDGVHGSRQAALDAAVAWRTLELESQPCRLSKRVGGYGYVRRALRRYRTASGELRQYEAFEANVWDHDGRPSSTAWSIERHGEDRARAECEAWLESKRSELLAAVSSNDESERQLDRCG